MRSTSTEQADGWFLPRPGLLVSILVELVGLLFWMVWMMGIWFESLPLLYAAIVLVPASLLMTFVGSRGMLEALVRWRNSRSSR